MFLILSKSETDRAVYDRYRLLLLLLLTTTIIIIITIITTITINNKTITINKVTNNYYQDQKQ